MVQANVFAPLTLRQHDSGTDECGGAAVYRERTCSRRGASSFNCTSNMLSPALSVSEHTMETGAALAGATPNVTIAAANPIIDLLITYIPAVARLVPGRLVTREHGVARPAYSPFRAIVFCGPPDVSGPVFGA